MLEKQLNGLPTKYKSIDSKPMHNFGDSSTWVDNDGNPTPTDSTFYMKPPADEAWVVGSVRIRFSANANFAKPMVVKYYMHGVPTPIAQTVYENADDFLDRCDKFELLEVAGNGYDHNIFAFTYNFNEPAILWGTPPSDDAPGTVRLSHFTMEVSEHFELTDDVGEPVEMVKVRYPDVVVYDISE